MWEIILKRPITNNPKKQRDHFMLKDNVWAEAGGRDQMEDEGFRFADLDDVEEILDRELTVDDFTEAPVNWSEIWRGGANDPVVKRISRTGIQTLARLYLKRQDTFPMEPRFMMEAAALLRN